MIEMLKKVGMSIGDFSDTTDFESKKAFLKNLTILPENHAKKEAPAERAIVIDFDLEKNIVSVREGPELFEENRENLFALSASEIFGPRGAKSALSLNGINYFLYDESVNAVIGNCEQESKLKLFLKIYRDSFYLNGFLNISKLEKSDKVLFDNIKIEMETKAKKDVENESVFENFVKNKFNIKFARIATVTFDGKSIFEVAPELTKEYIDMLYKNIFEKYFSRDKKGFCHICGESRKLADQTVPIWNFYGTSNTLYFQNAKAGNFDASFGICKDCLKPVMVGKNNIQNNFSGQIFGLDCFLLPHFESKDLKRSFFEKIRKALDSYIPSTKGIEELHDLINSSHSKKLVFDLLFYEQNKNEFRVRKLISNIELKGLTDKLIAFREMSEKYGLSLLTKNHENYSEVISLSFLRYALFHSKNSHPKCEAVHYRTELLGFLETFLYGGKFDYIKIIRDFIRITYHKFHLNDSNTIDFSPFKLILALQAFIDLSMLKNFENKKEDTKMLTDPPKDFAEFFTAHPKIYEDADDRQGLFLLGVLINRIIYAQREKSSNFMKKINLHGIEPRRVHSLLLQVKEFAEIYRVFEEDSIWSSITECLQEIENSPLSAEEVVFYILTGMSYAKYVGIKQGKQKNISVSTDEYEKEGE